MNPTLPQFYNQLLTQVVQVTGIQPRPLLFCNRTECVDARALLVNLLLHHHLTEQEVAHLTTLSPQCVNKLKNTFRYRLSRWSVAHSWHQLQNLTTPNV